MVIKQLNTDWLDTADDYSDLDSSYTFKPLNVKEHLKIIQKRIPFLNGRTAKFKSINPLIPRGLYEDKDVAFLSFNEQQYKNIGFVMFGKFRKDSDAPDTVDVFLARKDDDGVMLWRNLKSTPGFEDFYKMGNTFYTNKSRIVPGAFKNTRGSMVMDNNAYDILATTRNFFKKAELPGKEKRLLQGILENNYDFLDTMPFYKRQDSWSTKNNEILSGKLENSLFNVSQVRDVDILKSTTMPGEQYLLKRKMNVDLFSKIESPFKRNSVENRRLMTLAINEKIKKLKEEGIEMSLKDLKKTFIEHNFFGFKNRINYANEFSIYFEKQKGDIKYEDLEKFINKKSSNDYFDIGKLLKKKLKEDVDVKNLIREKDKKSLISLDRLTFKKNELKDTISKIEERFNDEKEYLLKRMSTAINSKADYVFDDKYLEIVNKAKDKKAAMNIIIKDATREFFDIYNEKIDLFEIMLSNRRNTTISEIDAIADRVEFIKDKNNIIKDVVVHKDSFFGHMDQDKDMKWAYYKVRNKHTAAVFDIKPMEERLKLAREYYKENERKLFEKHQKTSMLGKFDTYDNFKRAIKNLDDDIKHEILTGDIIARTNDKIISNVSKDNELFISGSIKVKNKMTHLNIKLNGLDGFNTNDYFKELTVDKAASFKEISLKDQNEINRITELYNKNYSFQSIVNKLKTNHIIEAKKKAKETNKNFLEFIDQDLIDEYNSMLSFLKGGKKRDAWTTFGFVDGRFGHYKNFKNKKTYSEIYNEIFKKINRTYGKNVGYLMTGVRLFEKEEMESTTTLSRKLLYDLNIGNINNATFLSVINRDRIINTSAASKQTGLIGGNSYLSSLGYSQPGIAFNKTTQRTYQAQDLLGEQYIETENGVKTISEINTKILNKLGFSGVGERHGKYTAEELYKKAINKINKDHNLNEPIYLRGETYKTFAIGDVSNNEKLGQFLLTFQEGMTSARSMRMTTNALRSKTVNINLDELNLSNLKTSKILLHEELQNKDKLKSFLGEILNEDLYKTIEGREKYKDLMIDISSDEALEYLDGSETGLYSYYKYIAKKMGVEKTKEIKLKNTEDNKLFITREIYNLLENAKKNTNYYAEPTTKKGKNIITNDNVLTMNELKPELGFSVRDYFYNPQTKNIELRLDNLGISSQGSKNQALGAKFTVSEVYDFLKLRAGNKDMFIDAVFNNKTEKRTQTGMMIHTLMQTAFTNMYETAGLKGVEQLSKDMKGLLSDLSVSVDIDVANNNYSINETYLTRDAMNKPLTYENFQSFMQKDVNNSVKLFTERGKDILEKVTKKYSSAFTKDGEKVYDQMPHFGVLMEINKAYSIASKKLNIEDTISPLTANNSFITGYHNNKKIGLGKGNMWLMKLPSERVNSNASKKKEGALKISRVMLEMLRITGYNELSNYVENKNAQKVSEYLGGVYTALDNTSLLNKVYAHNKNFDIDKVTESLGNTINNGVVIDLSSIASNDYLVNREDTYLNHNKLMENSILGRAIKAKGLDGVENGRTINDVNIVIKDKNLKDFVSELNSISKNFIESSKKSNDKYTKLSGELFEKIINYDVKNTYDLERTKKMNSVVMRNLEIALSKENSTDTFKMYKLAKMLNDTNNSYSFRQIQNVMKVGAILPVFSLGYDIDEVTEDIIGNKTLVKLGKIARFNNELNNVNGLALEISNKIKKSDKTISKKVFEEMEKHFLTNQDYNKIKLHSEIFTSLNFGKSEYLKGIQSEVTDYINLSKRVEKEIEGFNEFMSSNNSNLGLTKEQLKTVIAEQENLIGTLQKEIGVTKTKLKDRFSDNNFKDTVIKKLNSVFFNKEKVIINGKEKNFESTLKGVAEEYLSSGFDLLKEYITVPESVSKIFTNKGGLSNTQKFKINSAFVANPLEGSNYLAKAEEFLFTNNKNFKTFENKLNELREFLGNDIVNERLFQSDDGINFLERLSKTKGGDFQRSLDKARNIFSNNFSEISEVTITEKSFLKSFRKKETFETLKDIYNNKTISQQGYTREIAFLGRHPQQTMNHMGSVLTIVVDSKSKNLNNSFARLALTYLPTEKNNAGIVTLGKKTMLFRRGD